MRIDAKAGSLPRRKFAGPDLSIQRHGRKRLALGWVAIAACLSSACAWAQQVGKLEDHRDIGHVAHAGNTTYDAGQDAYTVTGSGANMWFTADEMQFAWTRAHGDVAVTAQIDFVGEKGNNHRKAALVLRQSLNPDSAYADIARHGDGLTSLQFRLGTGDVTREVETAVAAPQWVRIVKHGESVQAYVGSSPEAMHYSGASVRLPLSGDFYVGLAVCSHDKDVAETAIFRHLRIDPVPAGEHWGKLWSTMETVKAASSDRRVAYTTMGNLSEARWANDAGSVTFIQGDKPQMWRLDPAPYPSLSLQAAFDRHPEPAPAGAASLAGSPNATDWVYSSVGAAQAKQIWRMHPDGSAKEQMLTEATNDLAPSPSPDGKWLVYLALPRGAAISEPESTGELRLMSLKDRTTKLLANLLAGTDSLASPSWSPDSTRVVFVSHTYLP